MSFANKFFPSASRRSPPNTVLQLSPTNAIHFLSKPWFSRVSLIYWAAVSAASFDCCYTSVNSDCIPPFFQSKYWSTTANTFTALWLHLWQLQVRNCVICQHLLYVFNSMRWSY
jgi:hypothetical protein